MTLVLCTYGQYKKSWTQDGVYVDKILRERNRLTCREGNVEYELVVARVAQQLGIKRSAELLLRADEVIR